MKKFLYALKAENKKFLLKPINILYIIPIILYLVVYIAIDKVVSNEYASDFNSLLKNMPIPVFAVVIFAGIISGNEYSKNTVPNFMLLPVSRSKVLLAKYIVAIGFGFLFLLLFFIICIATGTISYGMEKFFINKTSAEISIGLFIFFIFIATFLMELFSITIVFLLAVVIRIDSISIVITIGLIFVISFVFPVFTYKNELLGMIFPIGYQSTEYFIKGNHIEYIGMVFVAVLSWMIPIVTLTFWHFTNQKIGKTL